MALGRMQRGRMQLRADGIVTGTRYVPSPNCDERPVGEAISLLVVHSISLPPGSFNGDAVERLFTNRLDHAEHPYFEGIRGLRVSAHFLVRRDGEILQFVPVGRRAWHAGASEWRGRKRCNDFSIGVELEGTDDSAFEPAQYRRVAEIAHALSVALPLTAIAAHSDIAPGRKCDPGALFEWRQCLSLIACD